MPQRPRPRYARVLCVACGSIALLAYCSGNSRTERPHIVLITSDTLRADHLSVNGYPRATSPGIDALAAKAWHFTDAVTVIPKTGPSLATMFTGRHPEEHGVRSNFEAVPETLPVLAERLRELGYRTAAFVGNPVLRQTLGYDRGFDHYELYDGKQGDGVSVVNETFLDWAGKVWDRPTFVWLHYMDPHGPYTPPERFERLFLDDAWAQSDERVTLEAEGDNPNKVLGAVPAYQRRGDESRVAAYVARYDAEIRYMDSALNEILEFLEQRSLYEPSAIVFTSDHGESLGEHDFYFEHGWFAYEPTLHVPLMIKRPGQQEGRVDDRLVSNLDFLPTLLGLAGAEAPSDVRGNDILAGRSRPSPVLVENSDRYPDKFHGVRTSRWKFLVRSADGSEELYDLFEDPGETNNLAREMPEMAARFRGELARLLDRAREAAVEPVPGGLEDPELLERLRSLGYTE